MLNVSELEALDMVLLLHYQFHFFCASEARENVLSFQFFLRD